MGVSETVLAAMIGAGATLATAMFQLVMAFRSSASERRSAKGGGLRSMLWMVAVVLAAGVGGFAYAEFRSQESRDETNSLRSELLGQMQALQASTARLEQMRLTGASPGGESIAGAGSSLAMVALPACRGTQVGFATAPRPCTEQEALQVAVCAPVPAAAQVTGIELFARPDDAQISWAEARLPPGQDSGNGRFADKHLERTDAEHGKLICQTFSHWSEKARTVRILVRYSAAGARTPG